MSQAPNNKLIKELEWDWVLQTLLQVLLAVVFSWTAMNIWVISLELRWDSKLNWQILAFWVPIATTWCKRDSKDKVKHLLSSN